MTDLPDVEALRAHDPPPGGLTRLRARLDGEQRRERRWWRIAVPALVALAVVAWLAIGRDPEAPEVATRASSLVADPTVAQSDQVTFYWVASSPASEPVAARPIVSGPPPEITTSGPAPTP